MIEVDPSEPRDTGDNIVIPDSQDKVQVVQTSDKPASSVLCDVSKAPVALQDSSHTQSGHQALVPEVALQSSTVDPTIPEVSASGSLNMAPAAMETQDTIEDESLPPAQSTPVKKVLTPDSWLLTPDSWLLTHNFSDEIKDIALETSVATQAEGLITGIRRIRCILREGVARTDMLYKESIMDEDGTLYAVLISVEGRLPKCLKCEKLGHIRRDCKAKKCRLGCYHMTDEHVTATCPYKGQYSTRVGNPPAQQQTYRQTRSVRLQHPPGASRPSGPTGPNITCYQEVGRQALGVTEKQLATDLEEEPFTEVVSKRRRRNQRKSSIGSQENTPVTPPEKSSTSMPGPPQGETPEPEPFPDLHLSTGVASSGKTPYVQQVHVPKGTAFTLEAIQGKSDKADPPRPRRLPQERHRGLLRLQVTPSPLRKIPRSTQTKAQTHHQVVRWWRAGMKRDTARRPCPKRSAMLRLVFLVDRVRRLLRPSHPRLPPLWLISPTPLPTLNGRPQFRLLREVMGLNPLTSRNLKLIKSQTRLLIPRKPSWIIQPIQITPIKALKFLH